MKLLLPVLAALCLFAAALPARSAPSTFDGLTVTRIIAKDAEGNAWTKTDQIAELISIKPGDVFSADAVRQGISLLYLKGTFRDIRVDGFRENGGVRLEYTFFSVTVVDDVVVRGNDRLPLSLINDTLPRLEQKELHEDKFPEIRADLLALYQAHGYFEARVSFRVVPLAKPHRVALHIDIDEGPPTIIEKITFSGNTVFKDRQLLAVMKSRVGKPLDRDLLLDRDLEAIREKYTEAGYPAAKPGPVSMSFEGHKAFIRIHGSEGPRVSVRFEGNKAFRDGKLEKALLIRSEHDVSDVVLDSSADKIKTLYREAGYADVSVEVKESPAPGRLDLTFVISEGPRVKVGSIRISGNKAFTTRKLKDGMALREPGWFTSSLFREDLLEKDMDGIRDRYDEAGYLSASVRQKVTRSADGRRGDIDIEITEGARTTAGAVVFEGNTVFSDAELLNIVELKPGAPYSDRLVDDDRYRLLSAYSNKGYLYARVDADKTPRDGTVDVRYRITEDRVVRIGRIILRGNERTKDNVILRELAVKPGDAYDYSAILTSQQRIYRLGYFGLAKFEPVHPGEKEYVKDMLFTVEERPAGYGEISVGYGDLDRLRGSVEVGYRNLWGSAEYSSLRFEESDILKRAIFNYKEPWFLNHRVDANFSLVWSDAKHLNSDTREVYYQTRKTTAAFGIEKIWPRFKPSLTYQFENVVNYSVKSEAQLTPEDSGRVLVSSLSPALIWDLRDDVFNPRKGALFGIVLKEASRILWSQADFSKLTVQGSVFLPVGSSVLALSGRGGQAWPYSNTNETPIHERFYVGGSTTVRGYTQDSIGPSSKDATGTLITQGGQSMAVFNAEFRINPGEGLGFVLFTDAGNAWAGQEINLHDLRASYGAGIRYGTPIGPLRIDYGQKIDRRPGESPGELHFNIGNTF
jgi:outer membrane protein insertion porin family